jgi:hypothetical protein
MVVCLIVVTFGLYKGYVFVRDEGIKEGFENGQEAGIREGSKEGREFFVERFRYKQIELFFDSSDSSLSLRIPLDTIRSADNSSLHIRYFYFKKPIIKYKYEEASNGVIIYLGLYDNPKSVLDLQVRTVRSR